MSGLYFLFPVLFTILVSFLFVRAAAIALMMTGLDRKRAVFQALSSFTGTGFTTREAELVINHPTRRKIVSWLMVTGNAGFVAVIVTATSSFVNSEGYTLPLDILLLAAGIVLIYKLVSNKELVRKFEKYIEGKLIKSQAFEEDIVEDLLHLTEGYGLVRAIIKEDSDFIGKPVSACEPCGQKVLILGIERKKDWMPMPPPEEHMQQDDRLVVYGKLDELRQLFRD